MIQPIKGKGTLKPNTPKLGKKIYELWETLGSTAVFTIGVRKNGEIDIISVESLKDKTPLPSPEEMEEPAPGYIG